MDNWQNLNETQKMKTINNGKIIVIVAKDFEKTTIPLFCPVCELPMKSKEDGLSFRKHGCCEKCDNRWTDKPGIDWNNKKYPNKSSQEWVDYYIDRVILSRPIIKIK
jgi:tRNA(Ile2) C34 agmatinyltransferase TiaS